MDKNTNLFIVSTKTKNSRKEVKGVFSNLKKAHEAIAEIFGPPGISYLDLCKILRTESETPYFYVSTVLRLSVEKTQINFWK